VLRLAIGDTLMPGSLSTQSVDKLVDNLLFEGRIERLASPWINLINY
jgi:hypothetical protein